MLHVRSKALPFRNAVSPPSAPGRDETKLIWAYDQIGRSAEIFRAHRQRIYERTDRLFAGLMLFQWLAAIAAAYWVSPLTWAGAASRTHLHVWAAIFLGGACTLFPVGLAVGWPGRAFTRYAVASGQMLMSALLIHLSGGRIETHFHVFGSLAFLAFYRDWTVFVPATLLVAADHFLRGVYWPQSVYGVLTASPWRAVEHADSGRCGSAADYGL